MESMENTTLQDREVLERRYMAELFQYRDIIRDIMSRPLPGRKAPSDAGMGAGRLCRQTPRRLRVNSNERRRKR